MKWQLDLDAGALYVYLHTSKPVRQREVAGVIADIDDADQVVGIEVLSAWAPVNWPAIASDLGLAEADVASIQFLAGSLRLPQRPGRAGIGATTAQPARVLTPA